MINFLHLSALLSLTSALCLQRNAKKMNGANISPSFYSFFIFFSIFVFVLLLLPSFLSILSILSFFLSYPFLLPVIFFFVCSSCLYLCFALSFLVFLFSFLLFCSSFFCSSFFYSSFFCSSFFCFSFYPFSEECDLQQKFHIDNVKHLPKFYANFLKARFLFET